jgi:hypothetical protein
MTKGSAVCVKYILIISFPQVIDRGLRKHIRGIVGCPYNSSTTPHFGYFDYDRAEKLRGCTRNASIAGAIS